MFKKLFGPRTAPNPEPGPHIGMLAFKSGTGLSSSGIVKAWSTLFPTQPPLEEAETDREGGNTVAEFTTGGRTVMLAMMRAPIPQGEIDEAAAVSWMWPDATTEMKTQKTHAIAVVIPAKEPVDEALAITRLLAAAASVGDPAGIYWGGGGHVHKPSFFVDAAKSFDEDGLLPCMLWVGLRISGASPGGPFTLTTRGMSPFGHKELEILDTTMSIGDLRSTTYDLINYLLSSGPVFKHNQTFGPTPDVKWKIEHTTSKFRKGEHIIRLHIP